MTPETPDQDRERKLADLETRIEDVREEVAETVEDDEEDQRFHESGTHRPDEDDQTIAPPG